VTEIEKITAPIPRDHTGSVETVPIPRNLKVAWRRYPIPEEPMSSMEAAMKLKPRETTE
jgi:hypothetical protein